VDDAGERQSNQAVDVPVQAEPCDQNGRVCDYREASSDIAREDFNQDSDHHPTNNDDDTAKM
jgi:hypothetical protein